MLKLLLTLNSLSNVCTNRTLKSFPTLSALLEPSPPHIPKSCWNPPRTCTGFQSAQCTWSLEVSRAHHVQLRRFPQEGRSPAITTGARNGVAANRPATGCQLTEEIAHNYRVLKKLEVTHKVFTLFVCFFKVQSTHSRARGLDTFKHSVG